MRAVRFHAFGGPDQLRYEEVPDPVPAPAEAVIRVEACAINHFDIDLREGTSRFPLDLPHIPGLEVVGRIEQLPAGAQHDHRVGQRVMVQYEQTCGGCEHCLTDHANVCLQPRMFGANRPGGYAELTTARVVDLLPLSDELEAAEWAAVQIAFGTAWHLVVTRGELRPGETVLVNAAGSGVSSAAIEIAKFTGGWVIATAGSESKLETARQQGADATVNYSNEPVYDSVMRITGGRGVDLVVEHVGGELFTESFRALRNGGRLVTCGGHGGEIVSLDLIELFRSERRILGSRTWTRTELRQVISLVEARSLRPIVDGVFPLARAKEAHVRLAERAHYGKLVLVPA